MNIIMQGIYLIFEDPNMKGNLLELHGKHVSLSVNTLLNWFFFQNLIFLIYMKFQWQR
jgi:hypothetical protein